MDQPNRGAVNPHQPVLYQQILDALNPRSDGFYVDGTIGAGGHASGVLQASSPGCQLLGLDVDPQALDLARERLEDFGDRAILRHGSYTALASELDKLGWDVVDGVLLDLGVSSMQLDSAERGFSFQADAPLDMRFDPGAPYRAADLVNDLPQDELADLIYEYGEERRARQIARAIVGERPVNTTVQLANIVAGAIPFRGRQKGRKSGRKRAHPATRTFQALRIAVNGELDAVREVLPIAMEALAPGGRLAVISFHSLEDRIVKRFTRRESRDCICPPRQPVCTCEHIARLVEITRQPVRPDQDEVNANPRARSARLRVAEKLS